MNINDSQQLIEKLLTNFSKNPLFNTMEIDLRKLSEM